MLKDGRRSAVSIDLSNIKNHEDFKKDLGDENTFTFYNKSKQFLSDNYLSPQTVWNCEIRRRFNARVLDAFSTVCTQSPPLVNLLQLVDYSDILIQLTPPSQLTLSIEPLYNPLPFDSTPTNPTQWVGGNELSALHQKGISTTLQQSTEKNGFFWKNNLLIIETETRSLLAHIITQYQLDDANSVTQSYANLIKLVSEHTKQNFSSEQLPSIQQEQRNSIHSILDTHASSTVHSRISMATLSLSLIHISEPTRPY